MGFVIITAEKSEIGNKPADGGYWIRWAPHPRESAPAAQMLLPTDRFAEYAIHGFWTRVDEPREVPVGISPDPPLEAFVNGGRWIVQCPDCNSAQLASEADTRFFCTECLNALHGKLWRRVKWPKNRKQIEELLDQRPLPATRSWNAGEPLELLAAENADHGVAV